MGPGGQHSKTQTIWSWSQVTAGHQLEATGTLLSSSMGRVHYETSPGEAFISIAAYRPRPFQFTHHIGKGEVFILLCEFSRLKKKTPSQQLGPAAVGFELC